MGYMVMSSDTNRSWMKPAGIVALIFGGMGLLLALSGFEPAEASSREQAAAPHAQLIGVVAFFVGESLGIYWLIKSVITVRQSSEPAPRKRSLGRAW